MTEKISITCPDCHTNLKVSKSAVGKRGRCPNCENIMKIGSGRACRRLGTGSVSGNDRGTRGGNQDTGQPTSGRGHSAGTDEQDEQECSSILAAFGGMGFESPSRRMYLWGGIVAGVMGLLLILGAQNYYGMGRDAKSDRQPLQEVKQEKTERKVQVKRPRKNLKVAHIGQTLRKGQLSIAPVGMFISPVEYVPLITRGSNSTVKYIDPVNLLVLKVENCSRQQAFAPVDPESGYFFRSKVEGNYGSEKAVDGVCQFSRWPAWNQVGKIPSDIRPGEVTVLVFVVKKLPNPSAKKFTWHIILQIDDSGTIKKVRVPVPYDSIEWKDPGMELKRKGLPPPPSW